MKTIKSEVFNLDCIEGMKQYPDKYFELAIVDPPYGLERLQKGSLRLGGTKGNYKQKLNWDKKPNEDYFNELFRVSKNQIIWGANNFILPPTEYFCIWDKKQTVDNFATAEYAWVSMGLKKPAKIFTYSIHQHNQTNKIHPTQKPIKLYKWILQNYTKEGDKILDTHLGSGSSRIAAYDMDFEFTGFELDKDYFDSSEKRFQQHIQQLTIF
jgi:site-specific DNA-methyltransferase (adenine-specific)